MRAELGLLLAGWRMVLVPPAMREHEDVGCLAQPVGEVLLFSFALEITCATPCVAETEPQPRIRQRPKTSHAQSQPESRLQMSGCDNDDRSITRAWARMVL